MTLATTTAHGPKVLNQSENVEQFERKRHTEMDNIAVVAAWTESVRGLPGKV